MVNINNAPNNFFGNLENTKKFYIIWISIQTKY